MAPLIPALALLSVLAHADPAQCTGSGPSEQCRCPGNKNIRASIYAPVQTDFYTTQMGNAAMAYGRSGVGVTDVKRGLLLSVARVRTGKDPDLDPCFGEAVPRINDLEDLCIVIKEAIGREPPPPGSIPVFMETFTNADSLAAKKAAYQAKLDHPASDSKCHVTKKDIDEIPPNGFVERVMTQLGSEANGIMMAQGFKGVCDANGVDGLPATPAVLINLEAKDAAHVLAHELGHAIGKMSGKASQFPDIEPPNGEIHNIMVTKRAVTQSELQNNAMLNPFQVRQLCESPALGN